MYLCYLKLKPLIRSLFIWTFNYICVSFSISSFEIFCYDEWASCCVYPRSKTSVFKCRWPHERNRAIQSSDQLATDVDRSVRYSFVETKTLITTFVPINDTRIRRDVKKFMVFSTVWMSGRIRADYFLTKHSYSVYTCRSIHACSHMCIAIFIPLRYALITITSPHRFAVKCIARMDASLF